MNLADSIERRFLFGVARILFLLLAVAALGAIAVDIAALCLNRPAALPQAEPLSPEHIVALLPKGEAAYAVPADPSTLAAVIPNTDDLAVPASLNAAVSNDPNLTPLVGGWIAHVPGQERQGFIDGLGNVAAVAAQRAEKWEWDDRLRYVTAALSEYATLRIERIEQARQNQLAADARAHRYLIAAVVLVVAVGGLTVILLLLAIERNTRMAATRQA
jgi:hypothetical protein